MKTPQLDYSLISAAERTEHVTNVIAANQEEEFYKYFSTLYNPHPTASQALSDKNPMCKVLETMANYILYAKDNPKKCIEIEAHNKSFSKKKKVVSLEGVLENEGESAIKPMEKTGYRYPKPRITESDLANVPGLRALREGIEYLEKRNVHPKGTLQHYRMRHLLIGLRREQYALKDMFVKPIMFIGSQRHSGGCDIEYEVNTVRTRGDGTTQVVSHNKLDFTNPVHIYCLLKNYSALRQHTAENLHSNMRYILDTLESIVGKAQLSPARLWVLARKVDGADNAQIRDELQMQFGLDYQSNYISIVFKQEICRRIAQVAELENLRWEHRGDASKWKKCTWCGEEKLRDEREFVRKKTTYDGLSNRCKVCDKNAREAKAAVSEERHDRA